MTSGVFQSTPITSIIVNRVERQRKELTDIESLADSIRRIGLIHPILIRREDNTLVVGERRLAACKALGWTHINTQYEDQLDETELQIIELEENLSREDPPWADVIAATEKYHKLKVSTDPSWTQNKTAEALGITSGDITERLQVAAEVKARPELTKVPQYSTARNIVRRSESRKTTDEKNIIGSIFATERPDDRPPPVLVEDFNEWAPLYEGSKFNFIHCDFPYGINADKIQQGSTVAEFGGYADTEDAYWQLIYSFAKHLDKFCMAEAHLVFWFSMKYYSQTVDYFRKNTDFIIDDFPLIWHKTDNRGLLPDPHRGPRRLYETALFGRRGDRKVVAAVNNIVGAGLGERIHMSQKPEEVLRHFFRMLVDKSTSILDPTCGSGSALIVAEALGAKTVLGLERNKEFADGANLHIEAARKKTPVLQDSEGLEEYEGRQDGGDDLL